VNELHRQPKPKPKFDSLAKIFQTNPEKPKQAENDNVFFEQTLAVGRKLASLFEGIVLTEKTFSICKT
jgi:hypothetical protein